MLKSVFAGALVAACAVVHGQVIVQDDFDGNQLGRSLVPTDWSVVDGTVDIIGAPNFFDLTPGNGKYIDLDGSSSNAGVLSRSVELLSGIEYVASFDIAGNQRGGSLDTVDIVFGTGSATLSFASAAAFQTYSLNFTPIANGVYTLSFANRGGDNVGALLDNVLVSSVPEPSTYLMLLLGLVFVGSIAFHQYKTVSPRHLA